MKDHTNDLMTTMTAMLLASIDGERGWPSSSFLLSARTNYFKLRQPNAFNLL
jgi:hypothetical protein